MQGDAKVIEYLNRGLRHELTAINQYWLHYRLLNNWGLLDMAKVWRKESIEEMEHADKFTDRILFLDGFPNLQVLDPLHIEQILNEMVHLLARSAHHLHLPSLLHVGREHLLEQLRRHENRVQWIARSSCTN